MNEHPHDLGVKFVLDCNGKRIYAGDYVQCRVHNYESIGYNERRRVQRIEGGCIVLHNGLSPLGASPYRPDRFRLSNHHDVFTYLAGVYDRQDTPKQEKNTMLHIAVRWRPGASMADMASFLQNASSPPDLLTGITKEEIQSKIRTRLSQYPEEQWIICSGNTIGERADPPVRFRSI